MRPAPGAYENVVAPLDKLFASLLSFLPLLLSLVPCSPAPLLRLSTNALNVDSPSQTTNVYIRLLPPNCTDELLHTLGSLFGRPISVRALLERKYGREGSGREWGRCKGVGFILYENIEVARRAVVGLNELGWQASFAKMSLSLSFSSP